jgi:hypothetical protein
LPLGPRFRGDDELICPQDFLTASFAGEAIFGRDRRDSFTSSEEPVILRAGTGPYGRLNRASMMAQLAMALAAVVKAPHSA